jgi:hypothetical protein
MPSDGCGRDDSHRGAVHKMERKYIVDVYIG